MSLEKQLSLTQNGGVYYEGTRVTPTEDPILFVGLGGTGIDALLRVKNEVQTRMPLPKSDNGQILGTSPVNIAFLALDTDQETFMKTYGVAGFSQSGDECVRLTVDGLPQVINSVIEHDMDKEEWKWFDRDLTANGGLDGANGIRQIGRFMLFQKINNICERFTTVIEKVLRESDSNSLKIFITTGIGGGTGSGTFLDVAYILRTLAKAKTPNVQIHGYIFTPDLNKGNGGDVTSLYRNGFASLKELDYWMSAGEHKQHFIQRYSSNFVVDSIDRPFDFCHLVNAQDSQHRIVSYTEAMDAVGSNLFAYIVSENVSADGNTALKEMYDNISGYITTAQKPYPANYNYLSIGSDKLEIPYTEITTLVAARVFEKLAPVFNKAPEPQTFEMDLRNLELTPNHLTGFIQKDVMMNPLQNAKVGYGDIWPSNAPKKRADQWLIHAQQVMRKNRSNFASVREGTFRAYMYRLIKDLNFGPCYAARLIYSNTNACLIKTLEGFREDCRERMSACTSRAGALLNTWQQSWAAGQNAGVFGKSNAVKEYMDSLGAWLNNEYGYWMYFELIDALDEFVARLKKYNDRIFKNLKDTLCLLPDIFQANVNKIKVDEADAQQHPENAVSYLIRPLEFERKFAQAISKKVDASLSEFLNTLGSNLKKWVGLELEEIDTDLLEASDIGGSIATFINNNFSETLTMNMETLLMDRMTPGEDSNEFIRKTLNKLCNDAVPLFNIAVNRSDLAIQEFSLISVPNDCPKIFSVANRPDRPRTDRPKFSSERSKLQWVKVKAGMPLFSFPEMAVMEEKYEYAMNTSQETRRGVHLRREWREELPSPLPEATWDNNSINGVTKAYSKNYNARIRAAFDKCVNEGIIRVTPGASYAMLYIADASKLGNLELHGTIQEKKEQLDLLRRNLWSDDSTAIQLNPFGSSNDQNLLERVRENILRFYDISKKIEAQVAIFSQFEALSVGFANVEQYVNAKFAGLIYEQGFSVKFRRSELDYSPIQIFDKMTQSTYPDYDMYKAFCAILTPEISQNIKDQFDRARMSLLGADGGFNAAAVDEKAALLNGMKDAIASSMASVQERIDRTPVEQRGALSEVLDFYQKANEIISDRLRSIGR
ncbi:MAG: hypothetical protein IJY93_08970 [Clostridia bacterium]|nr:hypothetical protein [Clostridia bacterium]